MAGESSDYDTAVKYLSDLTEVFAHQHDTEAVDSIRDLQLQLASAFQVQQTSAKDLIAGGQTRAKRDNGSPSLPPYSTPWHLAIACNHSSEQGCGEGGTSGAAPG